MDFKKNIEKIVFLGLFFIFSFSLCNGMQDENSLIAYPVQSYGATDVNTSAQIPVISTGSIDSNGIETCFQEIDLSNLNFKKLDVKDIIESWDRLDGFFKNNCLYKLVIKNNSDVAIELDLNNFLKLDASIDLDLNDFWGDYPILSKSEIINKSLPFIFAYISTGLVIPAVLVGGSFLPQSIIPVILGKIARIAACVIGGIGNVIFFPVLLAEIFDYRKLRKNLDQELLAKNFISLLQQNRPISYINILQKQEASFILCVKTDKKEDFESIKNSIQILFKEVEQNTDPSYLTPAIQFPGSGGFGNFAINNGDNLV
ncbi:hypothetical protein K9L05_04170 [Candidatus Babeliales bacterium]|nr:hypothetical protein [Candidatus Babeliales bacterium]